MRTLTNSETCTENCIRISYYLCHLSFSPHDHLSLEIRLKGLKYTCHGRFTEQFSESQPDSGESYSGTGGFRNAETRSWWWRLEGFLKLVSVFKEASKNLPFDFLSKMKTLKKFQKPLAHIQTMLIYCKFTGHKKNSFRDTVPLYIWGQAT